MSRWSGDDRAHEIHFLYQSCLFLSK
jgi:hypothetical protein